MTFTEIFEDIVSIMHQDYSGWKDCLGKDNPEEYRKQVEALSSEEKQAFTRIVERYLADFQDMHIMFRNTEEKNLWVGFFVRRYENGLYVVRSPQEQRLKRGDCLIALDGKSIAEVAEENAKLLYSEKIPTVKHGAVF